MIRINLLAVDRERTKKAPGLQAQQKLTVACSLVLLVALLGIGWWYWTLRQTSERLDAELSAAETEIQRLASVLEQVRQFEARRGQLEQRVRLIEQLRRGQEGPVHLLDQVSLSVPDRLWLTELRQSPTNEINIAGRAMTLTALSDFVANLEATGYFRRPVDIVDSQVEVQPAGEVVRFSVRAQFAPPGP